MIKIIRDPILHPNGPKEINKMRKTKKLFINEKNYQTIWYFSGKNGLILKEDSEGFADDQDY